MPLTIVVSVALTALLLALVRLVADALLTGRRGNAPRARLLPGGAIRAGLYIIILLVVGPLSMFGAAWAWDVFF